MRALAGAACGLVLAAVIATSAKAADSIYWTNAGAPYGISWAALDSSAAGGLALPGVTSTTPVGLTMDTAAGRAIWMTLGANKLLFAKLDGSGAGEIPTPGVTFGAPYGAAIDPTAGRVYIADAANKISFANLNGSGGGTVNTTGATVNAPLGLAVDPAAGRVYWANYGANKISFANLNGTGGGDINTTGATVGSPTGVAVDPAGGRIYWASLVSKKISFASLNGGGGADLNTTGATVNGPIGVAVDAAAGRLYWANDGANKISYARLDGTGGADLPTLAAPITAPFFVSLLKTPQSTAPPAISGSTTTGSTLTCSDGTWAPDITASFLFQAPQTLSYAWKRDNQTVAGASAKTLQASQAGAYTCLVTAKNQSGSAQALSAPVTVTAAGGNTPPPAGNPGSSTPSATPGKAKISFVSARKGLAVLTVSTPGKLLLSSGDKIRAVTRNVTQAGQVTIRWQLSRKSVRQLRRTHRLTVPLIAKLTPANGGKPVVKAKTILVKG